MATTIQQGGSARGERFVARTAFRYEGREKRQFPTPKTFGEYHEQLLQGRDEPRNAADRVLRALTNTKKHSVEDSPNGPIYHVFDERTDGLEVFGMYEAKRALIEALSSAAQTGGNENMILLVMPSGAGKSTLFEIVKRELMLDARENPLLIIEDCPVRETPDHLLTDKEREDMYKKTGRAIRGELCAHCQQKLEECHGDRAKMPIKEVRLTENAGMSELDPRLTKPGDWRTQEYLVDAIMRAAGGTLRVPEFAKQGQVVHEGMMDFWRGVPDRKITDPRDGKILRVDCLVIGDTTVEEFDAFFEEGSDYVEQEAMQALKDRMLVVKAPHNLSVTDEVKIYQKMLNSGAFASSVHSSPRLLESLAEIAVQSRLNDSEEFAVLTRAGKMRLYDGQDVVGFDRTADNLAKLREESRKEEEGMEGFSPPFIRKEVILPLFTAALVRGYDDPRTGSREKGCVNPIDAFTSIKRAIEDAPYELGYKYDNAYADILNAVKGKYEKWLVETVIGAFNKRHKEAVGNAVEDYYDAIERLLDGDRTSIKEDNIGIPTQIPIDVARRGVEALEEKIFGYVPSVEESRTFRMAVLKEVGDAVASRMRVEGDPVFIDGTKVDIKFLTEDHVKGPQTARVVTAVREAITGAKEGGEDLLRLLAPGHSIEANQAERIDDARTNLLADYDFCPCCVDRLMEHAAKLLPKKPGDQSTRRNPHIH